ncbi:MULTISPECIES: hypothetical protein [unclassified Simplicispira]|uniref:hypothetical protein n=1 Tax=unclassified Simplicispira TaxID=2630407 RepID=UPI000D5D48B1|nr:MULTISPECIES: hypothetical protein [unclassified Simplicispira]PVY56498.1 hypothetical protein C8D04_1754 [Simplicispira sp. 125]REG17443.1 hypothetical protein C8D01_2064 [Simplicispira sp. 110]
MVKVRNLTLLLAILIGGSAAYAGVIDQIDCSNGRQRPVMEQSFCRSAQLRGVYQSMEVALNRVKNALPAQTAALTDNQAQWERLLLDSCASEFCLHGKMKERKDALDKLYAESTAAAAPASRQATETRTEDDRSARYGRSNPRHGIPQQVDSTNVSPARLASGAPGKAISAAEQHLSMEERVAQAYAQRDAEAAALREAQERAAQEYAREQEVLRIANEERERQARENKAKADKRAAEEQARKEAQRIEKEEAQKRSAFITTWVSRIALALLAINLAYAYMARKQNRLVLFSSYTDIALWMGSPIVAFVISIFLAVFGLPDTAAKVVGGLLVAGAAGIVLLHTARTNHSFWMTASSFAAKCTLLAIGGLIAIVVYVLLAPGGRKKYERHASYERRSSAQTAVAMAAGVGAAAYLGHLLCERQEFVSLEDYFAGTAAEAVATDEAPAESPA